MDIKLPIKIHNKFEIEVKDIITGEIIQNGYAENIILDNTFNSSNFAGTGTGYIGRQLRFGEGTGTISSTRTTLFQLLGSKIETDVETVFNQAPTASYVTKKIVILPAEYVGETFTEVGLGDGGSSIIYTHALIKDSEGNLLILGPKTDTQEITIYRTTYFMPAFESGITISGAFNYNGLLFAATFKGGTTLISSATYLFINGISSSRTLTFGNITNGVMSSTTVKALTSDGNGKIKTIQLTNPISTSFNRTIDINLETLAENASTIWSGWEFSQIPIGTGDASTTTFTLTWDEAWITKPYKVYVDGIEVTTGFTFNAGNIIFSTAPEDQAVITADYWVKYAPKTTDYEFWVQIDLIFTEGSAS